MPIPALLETGFLPEGVYECSLDEISDRFGRFQTSDRRPMLNDGLIRYLRELREADIGKYLIVNGSFITQKDSPSDIDVLLVFKDDIDLTGDIPPFRLNAQSRKYVNKYHKLDFHCGFENDSSVTEIIDYFKEVKYQPGNRKGILKIIL